MLHVHVDELAELTLLVGHAVHALACAGLNVPAPQPAHMPTIPTTVVCEDPTQQD